ncbi:MAG TPA: amino acid adenylation domain-containing protein [Ignavibacteria bacterium]|nr:amino acid adenylation domain-containing protein [Ignavibacteria bacterium]
MSYGQKALYFLYLNDPESPAYNVAFTARILSEVNVNAFRKALQKLINRHPSLRTNYFVKDGVPVQEIHGYKEVYFEEINASGLSETELREKVKRTSIIPFDLESGDLIKTYLFKISDGEYVLLTGIHHIANDGFSMSVLLNELKYFYEIETGHKNEPLPALQYKYTDYIKELDEFINSDKGNTEWEYWKEELSGELPVLNLPADKSRPPSQTFKGSTEYFHLEPELVNKLKNLAREEGTTLFVTLLSAYELFLHRYTGQDDIIVGTPTSGRFHTKFENIIGYFINPVAIRSNFEGDPVFKDYLSQVKKKVLNAITNEDLPFSLIVDRLHLKRDPSRSAVFQTFFGLQRLTGSDNLQEIIVPGNKNAKARWGDLDLRPFEISQQEGQFDLTLEFAEGKEVFSGAFKYNTDLFERETVREMAVNFNNLLNSIVDGKDKKISELEILSSVEKDLILNKWNDTDFEFKETAILHKLFEKQAEKTPDNAALVYEGISLSYHELNTRSNQLANYLIRLGAGSGTLIGLCIERSAEMVIGLLGILKSGSAYIPIDTDYPQSRIEFMINDSNAKIIITQKSIADKFPNKRSNILIFDDAISEFQKEDSNYPDVNIDINDPAYVIYTSGSTGTPKGVIISHRSISNHMLWMKEVFRPDESDSVLQKTPFSFDASVWEFYLPLISGGKLVMAKPEGHMDMPYLTETIIKNNITILQLVPSLLRMLLEEKNFSSCKSLINVFCGGEALTYDLQEKLFSKLKVNFYNLFGPTEATIDSTYFKCESSYESRTIPVGKPVYNAKAYILDKYRKPVPAGVSGELYLGGVNIAKGYLNNPELTKERFSEDVFTKNSDGKLYRTGDIARYLKDGNIEFLGRADHQVKFRGFRIELGEIETRLTGHSAVRNSVVIIREDKPGNQRLTAYFTVKENSKVDSQDLKDHLRDFLPAYMIPSDFIELKEIPLTPNLKIDRDALPEPDKIELSSDNIAIPELPVEKILLKIWKEILGEENIGIKDNFFNLGGDSIISIQIISKAGLEGIKITPKQMFKYQTIAELAGVVEYKEIGIDSEVNITGEIPLTPAQHWFFGKDLVHPDFYNHSMLLRVPKDLSEVHLGKVFTEITKHHDGLRSKFTKDQNDWKQIIPEQDIMVQNIFSVKDIRKSDIGEIKNDIAELQSSINLENGILIKSRLYRLENSEEDRLLIIIHHLVTDGISWRILLDDIYNGYKQLSNGEEIRSGPKTTSLKTWGELLIEYSESEQLTEEKDYWLKLSGEKYKNIPADFSQTKDLNTIGSSDTVTIEFDTDKTELLQKEVPKAYNTQINDILLTALITAYNNWSNENKLLIDLEGHGREELFENADLSDTTGWFTSIYPVMLNTFNANSNIAEISETIKSIKESLRQTPCKGFGFGILKYIGKDKSLKDKLTSMPEREVIFNYLGQFNEIISKGSDWKTGKQSLKLSQNKENKRDHLIEINSLIIYDKLKMDFVYSTNFHKKETIELFADLYKRSLEKLIAHCTKDETGGITPSDFSSSGLNQQELDNLLANLN